MIDSTNDTELKALLDGATRIAVVGASTNPSKASSQIPALLIKAGYTVIPVHPTATEILGQPTYPTLAEIPGRVDIVDVFRPAAEAPAIAEQAVAIGAGALWLQLGITSPEARRIADQAELTYLEDICIGATTQRLGAHPVNA
jgi:predicted CoA-binding protein